MRALLRVSKEFLALHDHATVFFVSLVRGSATFAKTGTKRLNHEQVVKNDSSWRTLRGGTMS